MRIAITDEVVDRLESIASAEGVTAEDLALQAVGVWSLMSREERRTTTLVAMRNALRRLNESGEGGRQ